MLSVLIQIFSSTEIRKRILFTLFILAVFRIGVQIPAPGINPNALLEVFGENSKTGFIALINLFSGGALSQFSIFSLGIMPYISASIITQLLKVVIPKLDALSKQGTYGRKKINSYIQYGTVFLCIIQSIGLILVLKNQVLNSNHPSASEVLVNSNLTLFFVFTFVLSMTTGTMFLMWMGERISEMGIGNGISLLIFSGIVARLPQSVIQLYGNIYQEPGSIIMILILMTIFFFIMGLVVAEQRATRRIPIQYAKRILGRRVYQSQSTYIPFKINPSGVIPIIFASSIIIFPSQIIGFFGASSSLLVSIANSLSPGRFLYMFLYMLLVIFFAYFYMAVYFNPADISAQLQKEGGFIPGIRPGIYTANYLSKILNRITLPGSIFLGLVAITPDIIMKVFSSISIPSSFAYLMGGTSLLIMVGVALDLIKQLESYLLTLSSNLNRSFQSRKRY